MSEILVSIIVPIYNGERHILKCIQSILNQTEKKFELILVDDGSTDDTGAICDSLAGNDKRIKVIHQENSGVSVARNSGIAASSGKYIGFVDADDWILPSMYQQLLSRACEKQADMGICDALTVYSSGERELDTIRQLPNSVCLTKNNISPELLLELAGATWRCIYSRNMLESKNIMFPAGIRFSEDRIFNIYTMGYANKIYYLKEAFYIRFMHDESVVHKFHSDYYECVRAATICLENALKQIWGDGEEFHTAYLSQFIGGALASINNYYYKTSTFSPIKRYQAVKRICSDTKLREAIKKSESGGIRGRWILNRHVALLCACAQFLNWKWGR